MSAALGERRAGVVDGGVEVFQAEHDALAFAERRRCGWRVSSAASHMGPVTVSTGRTGSPCGSRPVPCRLRLRCPRAFGGRGDGLSGGAQEGLGAIRFGEVALDITGHGSEPGPGGGEGVEVLGGPVPDLDREAEIVDTAYPLDKIGWSRKTISAQTARVNP